MSSEERAQSFSTQPSTEPSVRKPPISERKLEANRKNARRSTGPKTARGQRFAARNAITHGLLAREVVITTGEGAENVQQFQDLLTGLREYYEPVGPIEEALVDTISTCWWRKARVIRAENGEIRKRLDTAGVDHVWRVSDKFNFDLAMLDSEFGWFNADQGDANLSTKERWLILQDSAAGMRVHGKGLNYQATLLQQVKSEITNTGHIPKQLLSALFPAFGFCDYPLILACSGVVRPEKAAQGQPSDKTEDKQANQNERDLVSKLIDDRLDRIKLLEKYAEEREKLEVDAEARSFSLPPADVTDKLMRYESHLDRQLYRAMDQLERLQRARKGENVPPPLNINLGRKG